MATPDTSQSSKQNTSIGCLTRLTWVFFGNIAVLVCAGRISQAKDSFFSLADAIFWAVVLALAGVRYLDITRLDGLTAYGQPASAADWRRYALFLVVIAFVVWVIAHVLAYLW